MAGPSLIPTEAPTARGRRGRLVWWAYLSLQAILFVPFAWVSLEEAHRGSQGAVSLAYALLALDALGLAGLFFWLRGIAFFDAFLWRVVVLLLIVRLGASAFLLSGNILPWEGGREQVVAVVGLLSIVAVFPLVIGLWCYAFRCPALWADDPATGADRA